MPTDTPARRLPSGSSIASARQMVKAVWLTEPSALISGYEAAPVIASPLPSPVRTGGSRAAVSSGYGTCFVDTGNTRRCRLCGMDGGVGQQLAHRDGPTHLHRVLHRSRNARVHRPSTPLGMNPVSRVRTTPPSSPCPPSPS